MAQLSTKGKGRAAAAEGGGIPRQRFVVIVVAAVLIGVLVGVIFERATSYPRTKEVVGTVEGLDSSGQKFSFRPDGGTPLGYDVGQADGAQYLTAGARVKLTLVYLDSQKYVVGKIQPVGS